jgi:hypothetical protein
METKAAFAVVRRDHVNGHDYRVVRLIEIEGRSYGVPAEMEGSWFKCYSAKAAAYAAAKALGPTVEVVLTDDHALPPVAGLKPWAKPYWKRSA